MVKRERKAVSLSLLLSRRNAREKDLGGSIETLSRYLSLYTIYGGREIFKMVAQCWKSRNFQKFFHPQIFRKGGGNSSSNILVIRYDNTTFMISLILTI